MQLNRRLFLKSSTAASAAVLLTPLPGCGFADGTFENPYTRESPGEWGEKIEVHQPRVFASVIDPQLTRLWIEVEDDLGVKHEQTPAHYISRIVVQDQDGNVIANTGYAPESTARVVLSAILGPEVTELYVYEECNLHGVWLAVYPVNQLKIAPVGDERRPLSPAQPGEWPDKIEVHMPTAFVRPDDGAYIVEIGDRSIDKLHGMSPEHYIDVVFVLDQNGQEVFRKTFQPTEPEPIFAFAAPPGTTELRVIASCNLHDWWEAVFGGPG